MRFFCILALAAVGTSAAQIEIHDAYARGTERLVRATVRARAPKRLRKAPRDAWYYWSGDSSVFPLVGAEADLPTTGARVFFFDPSFPDRFGRLVSDSPRVNYRRGEYMQVYPGAPAIHAVCGARILGFTRVPQSGYAELRERLVPDRIRRIGSAERWEFTERFATPEGDEAVTLRRSWQVAAGNLATVPIPTLEAVTYNGAEGARAFAPESEEFEFETLERREIATYHEVWEGNGPAWIEARFTDAFHELPYLFWRWTKTGKPRVFYQVDSAMTAGRWTLRSPCDRSGDPMIRD